MPVLEEVACRQYVELVTPYVEGELEGQRASWFEQHQLVCEGCALYLDQMRQTVALIGQEASAGRAAARPRVAPLSASPAYKFLTVGRVGRFSGFQWEPGIWVDARGPARGCARGIHACEPGDLPYWLMEELWRIELSEPVVAEANKLVASAGRLVERVDAWDEATAHAFAVDCAARVQARVVRALEGADRAEDAKRVGALAVETLADDLDTLAKEPGPAQAASAYAADAGECVAAPAFDAAVGTAYVAALAAAREGGAQARLEERAHQAEWLRTTLRLS